MVYSFNQVCISIFAMIFCSLSICWGDESTLSPKMSSGTENYASGTIEDITVSESLLGTEEFRPTGSKIQLSLEEAIDIALESNPQVRMSQFSLEQSLANLDLTRSSYRNQYDLDAQVRESLRTRTSGFRLDPDRGLISESESHTENNELVTIGPRYTRTFRNGSDISISPQFQFEHDSEGAFDRGPANPTGNRSEDRYSIDVRYNFPFNSRPRLEIQNQIENAKLSTIQSDQNMYLREQITKELVINNYWNIRRLIEEVEVQKDRLLQARRIEFIVKTQYEFENASEMQVGEAEIDVLNNEATLIGFEGNLRSAIESLNILLGIPVETQVELTDELNVKPLPMSAKEYVHLVTETNLELENIRISIQQAENNLQLAQLGQQPNLTLSSFLNRNDEGRQDLGTALVFSWPFGDGGATKARVRAQEQILERLRIDLWDQERQLVQEVYNDLRDLQLEKKRIQILERNVEQAKKNLDNALFNFQQSGRISFRNLQDFQIELARGRSDLIRAMVTYNVAKSRLLLKVHDYEPSVPVEPLLNIVQ